MTRTIRGIESEVTLGMASGAMQASVINCDDLFTIDKARLIRRIGHLPASKLDDFHRALRFALEFE